MKHWTVYKEASEADMTAAIKEGEPYLLVLKAEAMPGHDTYDTLPPSFETLAEKWGDGDYLLVPQDGYARTKRIRKIVTTTYEEEKP